MATNKIEPTVGRVVWYWPIKNFRKPGGQPHAAQIARVNEDGTINIAWLSETGAHHSSQQILLWQGDGEQPEEAHCQWMPYQKGQAAKVDALEAAAKPAA